VLVILNLVIDHLQRVHRDDWADRAITLVLTSSGKLHPPQHWRAADRVPDGFPQGLLRLPAGAPAGGLGVVRGGEMERDFGAGIGRNYEATTRPESLPVGEKQGQMDRSQPPVGEVCRERNICSG
jgi:hypothetical protein